MKNILLFLSSLFLFACNQTNSVTFVNIGIDSQKKLTLLSDSTFRFVVKATDAVTFDETGKFTYQDSLIIIDYTYDQYSYECYDIPLQTDTLLIVNLGDDIILFPVHQIIHDKSFAYSDIMNELIRKYNSKEIFYNGKDKFLHCQKQKFESFFGERKYIISEEIDSKLKVN